MQVVATVIREVTIMCVFDCHPNEALVFVLIYPTLVRKVGSYQ